MIKVLKFGSAFGLPDASPFVHKVETYLRITDQKYETTSGDVRKAPRKQLPFIDVDGTVIADSSLIVDHLESKREHKLDAHLDAKQRALGTALKSMLEEHFYFGMLFMRWATDEGWAVFEPSNPRDAGQDGRAGAHARNGLEERAKTNGRARRDARARAKAARRGRRDVQQAPRCVLGFARRFAVGARRQADDVRRDCVRVRRRRAVPVVRERGPRSCEEEAEPRFLRAAPAREVLERLRAEDVSIFIDVSLRQHVRPPARSLLRARRAGEGRRRRAREGQPRARGALGARRRTSSQSAGAASLCPGNAIPAGAEPIALAYAGHQFGGFVPQLGDGRAILLGEVVGTDGKRRDVQLKGAGRTPFSRGGDGRAALGPVLREYLVSEAMAALGIPTTRALAAVTTGEPVVRETALPGAVLTRVAASHIRVGTFEFFAARDDREALAALAAYALARHYPDAAGDGNDALALLERVIDAQANLVARWLGVGFVHGVMNTDNTSISGETIDYGPCAFLDEYDPKKKFSSIDHGGRYAFANQPRIAQWNLSRFAEALLPVIASGDIATKIARSHLATERLSASPPSSRRRTRVSCGEARARGERTKGRRSRARGRSLGTARRRTTSTTPFSSAACALRRRSRRRRRRRRGAVRRTRAPSTWAEAWRERLAEKPYRPTGARGRDAQVEPRLHPAQPSHREVIDAAVRRADFGPFELLADVLSRPYDDRKDSPALSRFADPPEPTERVERTFCGT